MSEYKKIGKIQHASFGFGGYQDAMIGVTFTLGSDKESWGCGDFWGDWSMERSKDAEWSEQDRIDHLGNMVMRVNKLLRAAECETIGQLVGKPVEVTFSNGARKEWRILTEAI